MNANGKQARKTEGGSRWDIKRKKHSRKPATKVFRGISKAEYAKMTK